jgi:hypothetical protein
MDIEKLAREAGLIEPRDVWADLPSDYRNALSSLAALVLKEAAKNCDRTAEHLMRIGRNTKAATAAVCAKQIQSMAAQLTTPPQEHNNG